MIFSSNFFLFLFLPAFLLGYYATPKSWRSGYILFGSWSFYAWWRLDFLTILIAMTLWNFWIGQRLSLSQSTQKNWLTIGVIGNLATLGYFKYFNFGLESWNSLLGALNLEPWVGWQVILPIGISFFTFQSISYLIDVYRGDVRPANSLINFAAFIALFPQLIAGPVLRYKDIEHQFESRTHSLEKFLEGGQRFIQGLAKKVLIADTVARVADPIFALEEPSFIEAWLGVIAYSVQLYFDFSGYSCMAIGLGLMMGFRFIENFNDPYQSRSITEFWQRWHISLSTWLRDYLYIPLGGNRGSSWQTWRNLGLTMLLGGLWHGAGWTFILWGAWHGGLLALERKFKNAHFAIPLPKILGVTSTMILVMIGWTIFRANDLNQALTLYAGMFGFNGWNINLGLWWHLPSSGLWALGVGIILIYCPKRIWPYWLSPPLFALSSAKLAALSYSPFLYFQF